MSDFLPIKREGARPSPFFTKEQISFTSSAIETFESMIQDFFGNQNSVYKYDTLVLPHLWDSSLTEETAEKGDILALQTALIIDGAYPPKGRSKNDCPRTGNFGDCTLEALEIFQNKYKISGEEDVVGKKTREILNGLYSI